MVDLPQELSRHQLVGAVLAQTGHIQVAWEEGREGGEEPVMVTRWMGRITQCEGQNRTRGRDREGEREGWSEAWRRRVVCVCDRERVCVRGTDSDEQRGIKRESDRDT